MIQALKSLASPVKGMFRFPLWLPESKEGLPGVISANPQGIVEAKISLPNEIVAQLGNDFFSSKIDEFECPDVIVGTLNNGLMATMLRNFTVNKNMKFSPMGAEFDVTYTPNILLKGRHYFEKADVTFDEITLGIHNLNLWMWRQIISSDFTHSSDMGEGEMKVQYKGGKTVFSAQLQDSSTFELKDRVTSVTRPSMLGNDIHEAAVTASHFVHYKPVNPMGIDDVILNIRAILNFFSLGLGYPTHCLSAKVSNHEMRKSKDSVVGFYVHGLFSKTREKYEPKVPVLTLFPFSEVQNQLSDVINRWMELYREIPDPLGYYFSVEGSQSRYADTRFLAHARMIEVLHGKIFGEPGNDPECEKIKEDVISFYKGEHTEWLRKKLGDACRISFRTRVSNFVSNFVDMTGVALPEAENIITRIVRIRNRATHHGTLDKHDEYIAMDILGDFMSILIQYALLQKIKVSKSAYGEHVNNVVAGTLRAMKNI